MQTRIVGISIGDWSGDGHGFSEKFRVKITGSDVSNEALSAAHDRAAEAVGFPLRDLLREYEEGSLFMEQSQALMNAGFVHVEEDEIAPYYVEVDEDNPDEAEMRYTGYSSLHLALFYLGYGIEDFGFEILVEPEYVVGEGSKVVPSFGYGLFS